MGDVDSTAAGILYNCIGYTIMVTTNGKDIISAFTYGYPVDVIYNNGVQVWPTSSLYYLIWTPTSLSGTFSMNSGETKYFENYNGFYSGPFYTSRVTSYTSWVSRCYIDDYAFESNSEIRSVATNCEMIGFHAFADCTSLLYVHASAYSVKGGAFENCTSLYMVDLPNCSIISKYGFSGCNNLKYVSLPECISTSLWAFLDCTHLDQITLPKCEYLASVTFENCYMLDNVVLPVCSAVASAAFLNCSNLQTITLGYSGVAILGDSCFYGTWIDPIFPSVAKGSIYVPSEYVSRYKNQFPGWSSMFFPISN